MKPSSNWRKGDNSVYKPNNSNNPKEIRSAKKQRAKVHPNWWHNDT